MLGQNVPFPPMEAELVSELPDRRRLAVRAEVGRVPRRARERRRRARALVAEGAPAAPLLPRAAAARRPPPSPLRARRRDRHRAGRRPRLRRDADAPPSRPRAVSTSSPPRSLRSSSPSTCSSGTGSRCTSFRSRAPRLPREVVKGFQLSPCTHDLGQAQAAGSTRSRRPASTASSPSGSACRTCPGSRDGVTKVKPYKTADCVVVGVRWKAEGRATASRRSCSGSTTTTASSTTSARRPSRASAARRDPRARARRCSSMRRSAVLASRTAGAAASSRNRRAPGARRRGALRQGAGNRFRHGTRLCASATDKDPQRLHLARGASAARARTTRRSSRFSARG